MFLAVFCIISAERQMSVPSLSVKPESRAPGAKVAFNTPMTRFAAIGVALCAVWSVESVASQVSPGCASDCVVDLQRVVTVSDEGKSGTLPEQAINVIRHGNGRYVVAARDLKRILSIDGSGKIAKSVEGPTDRPFSLISNLLPGPNGATFAFDSGNRSLTTIGADFSVQKVTPFPNRPNIALPNNQFVFVGQVGRPETVGYPLHLLDAQGFIVGSFGSDTRLYRSDEPLRYDRVVSPSSDGMVWAAAPGQYIIEKWQPTKGLKVLTVQVRSSWFSESVRFERTGQKPVTIIEGLWETDGLLWVLLRDADSKWQPLPSPGVERPAAATVYEQYYDSVLEAVAIRSGEVLASKRFANPLHGRGGVLLLSSFVTLPTGQHQIEVWKPQLMRRSK